MPFLDDLSQFLGMPSSSSAPPQPAPASGGMTNYGAAPTAQGIAQSSTTPTVLARLKNSLPAALGGTPAQSGGPSSGNPLGLSTPIGGNDLAVAMSGLSKVDPHSSKFGAFAQGLAGAMGARANAGFQSQELAQKNLLTQIEAMKAAQAYQLQQQQMGARAAGAAALNGGGAPPPQAQPPMQLGPQGGGAPPSMAGLPPDANAPPQGGGAPTPPPQAPQGGPAPPPGAPPAAAAPPADALTAPDPSAQAPKMIPHAVAAQPQFWSTVAPDSNPAFLDQQASQYETAAKAAALDPETSKRYGDTANQYRQRALQIRSNGMVTLQDGSSALIPGFASSKATAAAIQKAAEMHAENLEKFNSAPAVTESGQKYLPNPNAPVQQSSAQPGSGGPQGAQPPAAPQTFSVDPKTAQVQTAIPQAPAGGGYPTADIPAGAKLTELGPAGTELAKADSQFSDMVGKAPTIDQAMQRYQSAAQALKLFQSGSTTDNLQAGAALAQSYGYPQVAQRILGGDPAAVQWLKKEGVNLTLDTLKAAQPRFAQAEFNKVSDQGVPSPENLPQANHQLISEGMGSLMRSKAFINDWQQAQQQGWKSPSAFYSKWSSANPLEGFVGAAQKQIGTFKGMDLPPSNEWVSGATYVAPTGMNDAQQAAFAKRGIAPGAAFRFNGRDAANPLQPIGQGQGFKFEQ